MAANDARFGLKASNWSHEANRALTFGWPLASGARVVNADGCFRLASALLRNQA